MKNPNRAGCNVIETIWVLKFPQVQGSLQLARKVALDQVAYKNKARGVKSVKIQTFCRCNEGTIAYENKARGVKSVKIQTFCQCNEGTIDDGPVKNQ